MFYYQNLLYLTKIFKTKLINYYYDNLLTSYFIIKKFINLLPKSIIKKDYIFIFKNK